MFWLVKFSLMAVTESKMPLDRKSENNSPPKQSLVIRIEKEKVIDESGSASFRCGFRIGGGIDQDPHKSPHGYSDQGIYVTGIHEGTPAAKSDLHLHDKILQVNGRDFTIVTHKEACEFIAKHQVLNFLVARRDE